MSINTLCEELGLPPDTQTASLGGQIYSKLFKDKLEERALEVKYDEPLENPITCTADDIWVFGYGSLVWKADFPYVDRCRGYVCGFLRRFFQNSIDHRGVPERPGRVVTLLHTGNEADRVYGMAYRIAASQKEDVLNHLDYREKNGYERYELDFHQFPDGHCKKWPVIMYIASKHNESYAGAVWETHLIARQIFTSAGPSGRNRDYLFKLASSMRQLFPGVDDEHLFALEGEVLKLIESEELLILESFLRKEIDRILCGSSEGCENMDNAKILTQIDSLKDFCNKPNWRETILSQTIRE